MIIFFVGEVLLSRLLFSAQIELRRHDVISLLIAKAFDGFTILQVSDLHVEMSEAAMMRASRVFCGFRRLCLTAIFGDGAVHNSVLEFVQREPVVRLSISSSASPRYYLTAS